NTVYALAKREGLTSIEGFGKALSVHFLSNNTQIERARIRIAEDLWSRVEVDGAPHGSTFARQGLEKRTARVSSTRDTLTIESGLSGLTILKSAGSAFEGFIKDEFTTLKETSDRIFATSVRATWRYGTTDVSFDDRWQS